MRISSAGGGLLLLRREKDLAGLCGPGPSLLGCGLSRPGSKQSCYQQAEDEPADVGEERDGAAVRLGVEQPEVRLDELVQEPEPEEDPGALGHSLQTYGWIWLIIGVILIAAGALLFGPSDRPAAEISRWVGIIAASLGAISAMFVMPYYPVWSRPLFILAVMVVYGLVAGNRRQCVAFGLRTRQAHGVWGGMTEDEPGDGEGQQDRQEADVAGGDAGRPEEHDQDEYRELAGRHRGGQQPASLVHHVVGLLPEMQRGVLHPVRLGLAGEVQHPVWRHGNGPI